MRSIETEGSTIDEAIDRALRTLRVSRDRVEVEIVSNATRGLFGLGGRRARVRATVRESLAARLEDDSGRDSAATVSRETASEPSPAALASPPVEVARTILEQLLRRLGVDCGVQGRPGAEPGSVVLTVAGSTSGLVIGRRGQTLDAIEYFLNRAVGRDGGTGRVLVDVEGYRERRQESLEQLALRLAEKATKSGRPVTLNPMSPRDRRVVHLALRDNGTVMTRSQGSGHYRKVLIIPEERTRNRSPRGE